jgi:4-aminobutyrate aminotransferase-like enzyme
MSDVQIIEPKVGNPIKDPASNNEGPMKPQSSEGEIQSQQTDYLYPWVRPYYEAPLVMSSAEGVWVRDVNDNEFLDLFAGILTTSIGHCHPSVQEAVQKQMARLGHTSTLYITEGQIEAAKSLAQITPGELQTTCFTNSGTEAVESAIATARLYTGRHEIVALRLSYSGRSTLTSHMTAQAAWRLPFGGASGVVHARSPYPYRSPVGDGAKCSDFFIDDLVEVIETTTGGQPAAFFAETIQGVAGYVVPPPDYFQRAAEVIRSYGGLFIVDEVQTGFGRTGKHWFGIEHWDVEPDIMVMAKGIANGFPVGATVTRPEIAEAWQGPSIATFGGNPIAMAAMRATLNVMNRENVPTLAHKRGTQLRLGLDKLRDKYSWVGEVRGMGLMQGIELVTDRATKTPDGSRAAKLLEATKEEGLLVGRGGLYGHVMRVGPSLLITEDEIKEALKRFGAACERVDG